MTRPPLWTMRPSPVTNVTPSRWSLIGLQPCSRALDAHPPTLLMRGAEEQGDRIRRSGRDAGDTIRAGLEHGPFPQQRRYLVENGHGASAIADCGLRIADSTPAFRFRNP